MQIHYSPTQGIVIKDFQGEEAELLMMFTYLRGVLDPESQLVIDELVTDILKGTHYDG